MGLSHLLKSFFRRRYDLDLEKVALEAVKIKIGEIFDKINVSVAMEAKDIVIRIGLPEEIMNQPVTGNIDRLVTPNMGYAGGSKNIQGLDKEANAAAQELLGNDLDFTQT